MRLSLDEVYEFEQWLLRNYQADNTVPFRVVSQILKLVRANVR